MSLTWLKNWLVTKRNKQTGITLYSNVKMGITILQDKKDSILKALQLSATYHHSATTSLYRFERAIDGDLKVLKKFFWGNASLALSILYDSFCMTSENEEYMKQLEMQKSKGILTSKIFSLYSLLLDNETTSKQFMKLCGVSTRVAAEGVMKRWQMDLAELNKVIVSNPDHRKQTFSSVKVAVSKNLGYWVDSHNTTVQEFAEQLKNLKTEVRTQQKQLEKWQTAI